MTDAATPQYVLQLRCPDRRGILATVTPALTAAGCDIREAAVYGDPETGSFFIRMHVASPEMSKTTLEKSFAPVASGFSLDAKFYDLNRKMRVLIAVSKFDHCLVDLIHKCKIGALPIDIVGVMSNHRDLEAMVSWHGIPFHHLPITKETKPEQEAAFLNLVDETGAELIALARYMQILSDDLSNKLKGRCINIHHSFLPSFKGARPYHQAHERGVKIIGATAHYVTADLDEGPIIEQEVRRVTHATTAEEMVEIGREVEASVFSRAIKWHAEHRVFLNGKKTVVLQR
ncbi:MAG: formyltetrahydrofolate deformylase [Pseudomonadota bacterium]